MHCDAPERKKQLFVKDAVFTGPAETADREAEPAGTEIDRMSHGAGIQGFFLTDKEMKEKTGRTAFYGKRAEDRK